jgi:hypothetical protein
MVLGMEDLVRLTIRTSPCTSALGSMEPSTKFVVLAWRSQILPCPIIAILLVVRQHLQHYYLNQTT